MILVQHVCVDRLRTTLGCLRGERGDHGVFLAPLPIRVAPAGDGIYEVIDGFKRLAVWRSEGRKEVPVVVELASGVAMKARLLSSNAPARTIGPMDEAHVAASLADDDGLSLVAIGKMLGKKRAWVQRRLTLARKLAPALGFLLDHGKLTLSTALGLCAFGKTEQMHLSGVIDRHALNTREATAFLASYRAVGDGPTREALLREPRTAQPPRPPEGVAKRSE
jgi:ParB-like chromosome segregation protein Spo0J